MRARRVSAGLWLVIAGLLLGWPLWSVLQARLTGPGPAWERNFETARVRAKREGRPVMVVFTAGWCPWCRKLERTSLRDPEVYRLSSRLVCVKVDADRETVLARRYRVFELPHVVFLSPDGVETESRSGYVGPDTLVEAMQASLNATGNKPRSK